MSLRAFGGSALGLSLALAAPLAAAAGGPATAGAWAEFGLETPHPYPAGGGAAAGPVWSDEVAVEGATYLVLHFARFSLAPGDAVVVRHPSGEPSYRLTGDGPRGRGASPAGFLAPAVPGDRLVIELWAPAGGAFGFQVDRLAHGTVGSPRGASAPGVCGDDDRREARCYLLDEPAVYRRSRAVARLLVDGTRRCTGWLFGDEGHLLTAASCVTGPADAADLQAELVAEGAACATDCRLPEGCPGRIEALGATLVARDTLRDYALVALDTSSLAGVDLPATYGFLQARCAGPQLGETVFVPQHPQGWGRQIAAESSHPADAGGRPHLLPAAGADVAYFADSGQGAGGAPAIATADGLVVALDRAGGVCSADASSPNLATRIDVLLAQLGDDLPRRGAFDPAGLDNDRFEAGAAISGGSGAIAAGNACATREPGEPVHGFHSLWWRWTAPASGWFELSTAASDFDTTLAVYTGEAPGSLVPVAAEDLPGGGETVRFAAVAGTEYRIATASAVRSARGTIRLGWSGEASDLGLTLSPRPLGADPGRRTVRARIANHGPGSAPGPRLALTFPPGLTPDPGIPCGIGDGLLTCLRPALAAGAADELDLDFLGSPGEVFEIAATVDHASLERDDPNPANDAAGLTVDFLPELALAVRALAAPAPAFAPRRWVVAVANTAGAPFAAVDLTLTLDPAPWSFTVEPEATCTCGPSGATCALGVLGAGETRAVAVSADGPPLGEVTLTATAVSGELAAGPASRAVARAQRSVQVLTDPFGGPPPPGEFGDAIGLDGDLLVVGGPGSVRQALRFERSGAAGWRLAGAWGHPTHPAHFPQDAAVRGDLVAMGSGQVVGGDVVITWRDRSGPGVWGAGAIDGTQGQVVTLGDELLVAAHHPAQAVHVFEGPRESWTFQSKAVLTPTPPLPGFSGFGGALATAGDRILVGAADADGEKGAAYLFERTAPRTWVQVRRFSESGTEWLGSTVALTADEAYVAGRDATFVYCRALGWALCDQIAAGNALRLDGERMAISRHTATVDGLVDAGEVKLFRRHPVSREWQLEEVIREAAPTAGNHFGWNLALQGDTLVTGAPGASQWQGKIYAFDLAGASIRLTGPAGGGALVAGQTLAVRWRTGAAIRGAGPVTIDLVRDGRPLGLPGPDGAEWVRLAAATADDGAEDLTVPAGLAAGADWRVAVHHPSGAHDASAVAFAVLPDLTPVDLVLTAAGPATAVAGAEVAYAIEVANLGPGTARGAVLTWSAPPEAVILTPAGCLPGAGSACTLPDLPPGATAPVNLTGLVAPDRRLPLAVTADALALTESHPEDNGAQLATSVETQADLALAVLPEPDPVLAGGLLVYRVLYTNLGPSTADETTLTHVLPDTFAVDLPPACAATGAHAATCAAGALAPGEGGGYSLAGLLLDGAGGLLTHTATVASLTPDPVAANGTAVVETLAGDRADLVLEGFDLSSPVGAGQPATVAFTVRNRGPVSAQVPLLEVTLPAGATLLGVVPEGACLPLPLDPVTCPLSALASGEAKSVLLSMTLPSPGLHTTAAQVAAATPDARPGQETASVDTLVEPLIFRDGFESGDLSAWSGGG